MSPDSSTVPGWPVRRDPDPALWTSESQSVGRALPLVIDCDGCQVRGVCCDDCVMSALLGGPPDAEEPCQPTSTPAAARDRPHSDGADRASRRLNLNEDERRAVAVLVDAGLVPPLRLVTSESATVAAESA